MIFYLAILLILCGFLIVISALFIEISEAKTAEDKPVINKTAEEYRPVKKKGSSKLKSESNKPEDLEIIFPDELDNKNSIFSELEDTFSDLNESEQTLKKGDIKSTSYDKIDQKTEISHSAADRLRNKSDMELEIADSLKNDSQLQEKSDKNVYAVMFDDKSDLIDYSSGIGTIDSTFLKYSDIKRIGKGVIESDSDGISFYLDERLYRFDLHRIYDIWCGENYVALPLKGNGIVKLFIIENSPDFSYKVEADFKEFEKR